MRIHQASASDQVITVCLKTWDVYQSLHPLPNANNAHAEDMRERDGSTDDAKDRMGRLS